MSSDPDKKFVLFGGGACPEQYDVFLDGEQVAYFRLRHGQFTAECPDVGGALVYTACPRGDGQFQPDEREHYLNIACYAVLDHLAAKAKPPLPVIFEFDPTGGITRADV